MTVAGELCERCGCDLSEHCIFHDAPESTEGWVEAKFSVPMKGVYCPKPCPDTSTCRNCGQAIVWDDYSYLHVTSGWAECGVTVERTGLPLPPPLDAVPELHHVELGGKATGTVAEPAEWGVNA